MTNTAAIAQYWDAAAPRFDEEPDHGLRATETRDAWANLLNSWLPSRPVDVLDVGCGTGSLSRLTAEAGHRVTGVDLSPRMVEHARAKLTAAGLAGRFLVGDAASPPTGDQRFDVLLSRHLMWTLPDPHTALGDWLSRVRPGGTLVLVEGRWRESGQSGTPYVAGAETLPWAGGIGADDLAATLRPLVTELRVEPLSGEAALWGRTVTDERYAVIATV
ncbi:class I SAM-dependent methyltransferase [Streptomyces sp. NBC_00316]|uniref:class I SAM-dependent methyltransferase n=1 Tax=Streptomyces sp. NBC_00316 TaxID=2975710 RepID=UPI002E2983C5|nr:class I SAM-dependent methyltransferase [Streptomyces sp. NBC_00316]